MSAPQEAVSGKSRTHAPSPKGVDIDKIIKFGWRSTEQQGVPYLASKHELHVDDHYQRSVINEAKVLQMASNWNWLACGSLIVAERDNVLRVVDGQHRWVAAMRRSDITELPALVFKTESAEEEAAAFFSCNCNRTNVTPFDKLRALLHARDQLAIDAVDLMEEYGYKPTDTEGTPNTLRCVAMFMSRMKRDRLTIYKVWPVVARLHQKQQIRARVLAALLYLGKHANDDLTSAQWQMRILKQGLDAISGAIDRKASEYSQGGNAKVFALGALEAINRGVRGRARMRLREPDDEADD